MVAACSHREPVASCADDLSGTWRGESGTWMIVDSHETLEGYPLFEDVPAAGNGTVVAPRLIDLRRLPALSGEVHRRFMQGATACEARAQIHVLRCADDQLELVLADPAPPFAFAPCAWAGAPLSRREIWARQN